MRQRYDGGSDVVRSSDAEEPSASQLLKGADAILMDYLKTAVISLLMH